VQFYRRYGKRALDIVGGLVLATLLVPLVALVALAVRIRLGSPVLFRQQRPGLHGQTFLLMKFRTMQDAISPNGTEPDEPDDEARLTRFGGWLRSTSLDELPEFWHVVAGTMSLVGPRPLLPQYLPLYTEHQARRHEVRPGITGLAQVSGRNDLAWDERLDLDVTYVDSLSLALDVKILARTVWYVLRRRGVMQEGHATVRRFEGSKRGEPGSPGTLKP
jgi:lipopolysaccharide/colanic/teichoic acid biosynthesis glycosyltransferase